MSKYLNNTFEVHSVNISLSKSIKAELVYAREHIDTLFENEELAFVHLLYPRMDHILVKVASKETFQQISCCEHMQSLVNMVIEKVGSITNQVVALTMCFNSDAQSKYSNLNNDSKVIQMHYSAISKLSLFEHCKEVLNTQEFVNETDREEAGSKDRPPILDEGEWSWREILEPKSFEDAYLFLRRTSRMMLLKQDTKYRENIGHALIICFSSPELDDLLNVVKLRGLQGVCTGEDMNQNLLLHVAVQECKPRAVELIANMCPMSIEATNGEGLKPWKLAVGNKQTACLKVLLEVANKNDEKGSVCESIFHPVLFDSIKSAYLQPVEILSGLQNPKMNWNCLDNDGKTAWYYLLDHSMDVVTETVNTLVNSDIDPGDLMVYPTAEVSLKSVLCAASGAESSEYVEVIECSERKKRFIKRSKFERSSYKQSSAAVCVSKSKTDQIKLLGSGSESSDDQSKKKKVHLSLKQKARRARVAKRIKETRHSTTDSELPDESTYTEQCTFPLKLSANNLQVVKADVMTRVSCNVSGRVLGVTKTLLTFSTLIYKHSCSVTDGELEETVTMIIIDESLQEQVYNIHNLFFSLPVIITLFVTVVQDSLRTIGFILFKTSVPTQFQLLFGMHMPANREEYKDIVDNSGIFKHFADATRSVKRSIPIDVRKCIDSTATFLNDRAIAVTQSSEPQEVVRGKKKKTPDTNITKHGLPDSPSAAKEEKCASLVEATRNSVPPRDSVLATLEFSNNNHPLEVFRSHFQIYSKCCTRHDIQHMIAIGNTCPAFAAFGPKKRDFSIKDLKDDTKHGKFDFSAQYGRSGHLRDLSYQQVLLSKTTLRAATREKPVEPVMESLLLPAGEPLASLQPAGPKVEIKGMQSELRHSNEMQTTSNASTRVLQHTSITEVETCAHRHETGSTRLAQPQIHTAEWKEDESKEVPILGATTLEQSKHTSERSAPSSRNNSNIGGEVGGQKDNLVLLAELLHSQYYVRIPSLAYDGQPPTSLSPVTRIAYIFITGLAYYKMSNHKKSVTHFERCLGLAEECHRDGDVTICNIYLGDIDFAKRKYTEAAGRYQQALYQYSRDSVAKDFRMILPTKSAVWLKCGSAFKNASRVGDAVHAYEKAVELASTKKDQLSAHTSLGNLFQGIGENERAKIQYEEAIKLATELEDHISLGWNHGNLGNALLGLHQRDKALYHLFKALDMAVDHEMTPQAIGRAYNNLGTAFQSLNELSKAEEHYDLALAQAIYGNDIPGQARVYGNIGNLQMLNKHYDRAVPHYTEVMRLSHDKATITTAHHNRGCAYYDWAEKKNNSFFERINNGSANAPTNSHPSGFKISLHGPDFEHCEEMYRPRFVPEAIQKYYLQGTRDLDYVIKHHEESFSGIKGSSKGLSLSVSLFETNSRTFHRMQDCLIHLQKSEKEPSRFEDALLVAEQSRARTLGELLLRRRGPQLEHELVSPPSIHQLKSIVARQSCPVVYLSFTGERLMGWILYPTPNNHCSINMFQVPLSDSEFDGKSFDYHLRYSLNEQLVEKSFEMYKPFDNQKDKTEPLEKLYDLVARPLMTMLNELDKQQQKQEDCTSNKSNPKPNKSQNKTKVRKIVIIPDSYTNLLPFTCVLDRETGKFWGDNYYFQIMPSLLTMGILQQLPTVSVSIPVQYQQMLCVVGNPTIPRFKFNNDEWDLGKLPHATKEAQWVSHILKCNPILHEQATKEAVMMRLMNAKVIHLATHGSAAAGFLAFAGMNSSTNEAVDSRKVLIYPHEVESLNISPALVVLSSCDSGRGVFKADGIQGMARAFILAGAQAVLTALWRVPDESACIFMQFFYQYLVDGVTGTKSLHKAILSLRCFSKYSQYIHWSGYQLTGREFQFDINHSSTRADLLTRVGPSSVFPRLDILKKFEDAFVNSPRLPTDVQVIPSL